MNKKKEIVKILVVSGLAILVIAVLWYFRGKDIEAHRREFPQKISHGGDQPFESKKCGGLTSALKLGKIFNNKDIFTGGCCPDECELP